MLFSKLNNIFDEFADKYVLFNLRENHVLFKKF